MSVILKIVTMLILLDGVDVELRIFFGSSPFCLSQDANSEVCQLVENFFGFMPFQQVVNILAGSLTVFTTNIQIQEILDYITQSFGPNPFNITDYESMSKSFNLIIFQPNSNQKPRNISSADVLMSCDALELKIDSVKLIWPGYGENCNGKDPSEIIFGWTTSEMQQFSDLSNSTIIAVDWGFNGLSCYGYIQITLCLIDKIADFFAYLLTKCVDIEKLELIAHSIGAQIVGYIAQHLASTGRVVSKVIGLDPAGPGYGRGLRCQGIQNGCSKYSMVFHSNPCQLGTCDFSFGDVNVLLNPNRQYCQPGCTCFLNPGCSHSYVLRVLLKLALKQPLSADYTQFQPIIPGFGEPAVITIYQNLPPGYYALDTYN